jgi:hypothetical protein
VVPHSSTSHCQVIKASPRLFRDPETLIQDHLGIYQDPSSDLEELEAEVRPEDVLAEMDAAERRLRRG